MLLLCLIYINDVSADKLRITDDSLRDQQSKVAANFPFDPPIVVELVDDGGKPVISDLTITAKTLNFSYCLSFPTTFNLSKGIGTFPGSFCEIPSEEVYLYFTCTTTSGVVLQTDKSKPITVTAEIHFAYFRPTWIDKLLNDQLEDFIRYAMHRLNSNMFGGYPFYNPLAGRTMKMKTYAYETSDLSTATKQYLLMQQVKKKSPHEKAHALIGMSSDVVSQTLLPIIMSQKLAVTSFRKDISSKFSDKIKYPYFNRLQLSVGIFLDNVFMYLKTRKWTSLVIIYTTSDDFYDVVWDSYTEKYGITLIKYEITGNLQNGYEVNLDSLFESITGSGFRIILTTATGNTAKNLLKQADKNRVTPKNGFQWIGLKNEKDFKFLSKNSEDWCIKQIEASVKLCVEEFKGMIVINNMYYNLFNSTESEFMWRGYLSGDTEKSIAPRAYVQPPEYTGKGVQFALAYDTLKVNILAMQRLIHAKTTINGETLSKDIRDNTNIMGMSGKLTFDNDGNRNTFIGSIFTLWPMMGYINEKIDIKRKEQWMSRFDNDWINVVLFERKGNSFVEKHIISSYTRTLWKHSSNSEDYRGMHNCHIQKLDWDKSNGRKHSMNTIQYIRCNGFYNEEHRQLSESGTTEDSSFDIWFPKMIYSCNERMSYRLLPAPFFCMGGCGGNPNISNVNIYANGVCKKHGVCKCNKGWSGSDCSVPSCNLPLGCIYGECTAPETCKCDTGYKGKVCDQAVCSTCGLEISCNKTYCDENVGSCIHTPPNKCIIGGTCSKPGICRCDADYYNSVVGKCDSRCHCNMDNGISCNKATGHCTACKNGYFSAESDCQHSFFIIFGSTGAAIVGISAIIYFIAKFAIKRIRLRAALMNNDWIVKWGDVKIEDKSTSQKSSMMISAISMNVHMHTEQKQFNVGNWDGIDVYYQTLDRDSITLTDAIRLEVKIIREMKHMNIAVLIGCCIESPNVSILTELQPKGSLEDIFSNDDIKLPWNFKFGLLKGVCRGMEFIHKSGIKFHGRLKSSNCLVDNRWTIKLSGFGLHSFKSGQKGYNESNYGTLLWTAPEILRTGINNIDKVGRGSLSNDIYAFGILLSEFCTRDLPFAEVMLEKEDLVHLVAGTINERSSQVWNDYLVENNMEAGGPVRPVIKDHQWPKKYEVRKMLKQLMETCWDENIMRRPHTIKDCEATLNEMDPKKGELIENLISMLEMYSTNLENVVNKRTKQLQIESQRTEDLVSRLLPKSVSENLKQGNTVEPENFDAVTVYFSDIVGFTSIAKASTPFEVIALLNNMYTLFDSISAKFDVYKVETIGDAYMIVSGLPGRNGDLHASEICTTALNLMSAIGTLEIPHIADTKLQLRSGVHTGNVVAGVVGLKMPRYCLFGDSVNVASDMESGGKPSRIQISGETEIILQRLGGYNTEYRHDIQIKSYGLLSTYWLNGKDGFNEPMPSYAEDDA